MLFCGSGHRAFPDWKKYYSFDKEGDEARGHAVCIFEIDFEDAYREERLYLKKEYYGYLGWYRCRACSNECDKPIRMPSHIQERLIQEGKIV